MENLNRKNLKTAIKGLKSLKISEQQFDMKFFGGIDGCSLEDCWPSLKIHSCDTVACVVGWCPFIKGLGVTIGDFNISGLFDYTRYSYRIFGCISYTDWSFMFCSEWIHYDNTLEGAIARMQHVYDGKYNLNWGYEDFKEGWHK